MGNNQQLKTAACSWFFLMSLFYLHISQHAMRVTQNTAMIYMIIIAARSVIYFRFQSCVLNTRLDWAKVFLRCFFFVWSIHIAGPESLWLSIAHSHFTFKIHLKSLHSNCIFITLSVLLSPQPAELLLLFCLFSNYCFIHSLEIWKDCFKNLTAMWTVLIIVVAN